MRLPVLCVLLAIAAPAQIVSPKYKSEHRQIHDVLILPLGISMQFVGLKGGRGLPDQSEQVAESLRAAIAEELTAKGANVVPNVFPASQAEEARYALADLQHKFDGISVQLFKKPHGIEKGRYTMGDGVSTYGPAAKADTLIFVRGGGVENSKNKQTLGWLTMQPTANSFLARAAFVDARSGEVLALARIVFWRDVTRKSEDALRKEIRIAFQDLPLPGKPATTK